MILKLTQESIIKFLQVLLDVFSYLKIYFLTAVGAVLGSQQNWEEDAEISHLLPVPTKAYPSPLSTPPTHECSVCYNW